MRLSILLLFGSLAFISAQAQKKILILGSSTSTCFFGPSNLESCYVTRLQRHFESAGIPVVIDNRAEAGDDCYQAMPLGYTPPAGRRSPRPFKNITEGLQGNPDVVLVNFPSNGYDMFSVEEVLFCLRTIKQTANAAGKPCYITTSQPRNDPESFRTAETRARMAQIKNSIMGEFGDFAINFWDEIVDPADNSIKPQYNADGTHLNDAGHQVLFTRVRDRNILQSTQPAPGGGLVYRYYEGFWDVLPDFNSLTPTKTGTGSNLDLSVRNRNDYFGMVWEGSIQIPISGSYTFELNSDDGSRFYLGSTYNAGANPLLNNDGLHGDQVVVSATIYLNAGTYPCAAAYFEAYGNETIRLTWSGPGIQKQPVPNSAFGASQPVASGLNYRYYEGDWNSLPNFNALTPVKSGSVADIDLSPRNRNEYFGFVWEGRIIIPVSGQYNFELESDDGSQFFFNSYYNPSGAPTINNDGLHGSTPAAGSSFFVNAGTYPVAASFFEKWGDESMRLYWSGPGIPRQLVPSSAFSSPSGNSLTAVVQATESFRNADVHSANIFPNPFTDKIIVNIGTRSVAEQIQVEVYDDLGRLVKKQKSSAPANGINTLEISMANAKVRPRSIYTVVLKTAGSKTRTFRVLSR